MRLWKGRPRVEEADLFLLGVDLGGSGARCREVVPLGEGRFALGSAAQEARFEGAAEFEPLSLAEQAAGAPPSAAEAEQARACVAALVAAIEPVARRREGRRIELGIAAPGATTPDGRGIAAARHLPRVPDLAARIERALGDALLLPVGPLVPDGVACGVGEDVEPSGSFHGVRAAYYAGAGTGLCECVKLDGRVRSLAELELPPAYELRSPAGGVVEDRVSAAALDRAYAARAQLETPLAGGEHATDALARGDELALEALGELAGDLAALLARRRAALPLERIVLGQRYADAFRTGAARQVLDWALEAAEVDPRLVVVSAHRAAPALGAAALAWERATERTSR